METIQDCATHAQTASLFKSNLKMYMNKTLRQDLTNQTMKPIDLYPQGKQKCCQAYKGCIQ